MKTGKSKNLFETSQYVITIKLFKQFLICYIQTDGRTEEIKIINEFLKISAENVSNLVEGWIH
jgi:hypothetical protein